jgi:cholesterol oxidase
VLVIGSGFGGAIAAARIAEAGFQVRVLERGPWRDSLPVRSMGIKDRAPFPQGWRALTGLIRTIRRPSLPGGRITLNKYGYFDLYIGKGMAIMSTSNVGGGSHAYGAVNMRPDAGYWNVAGLSDQTMDRHYANVALRLGSGAADHTDISNPLQAVFKDSRLLQSRDIPLGVLLPKDPANPIKVVTPDGVERYEARRGQDGTLGSAGGGKATLDFIYLHRAMRDHGLEVRDLVEATAIRPVVADEAGRYCVSARNLRTSKVEHHHAQHVFVAGGTMNTLELLLRSSEAHGGFNSFGQLGRRFYANGDLAGVCTLKEGDVVSSFLPTDGLILARDDAVPLGDQPWPVMMAGAMPTQLPLPGAIKRVMARQITFVGMGSDNSGRAYLKNNKLVFDYDPAQSPIYDVVRRALTAASDEIGGTMKLGQPLASMPMGGANIGRDMSEGVIDRYGEVFGCPGLYVTDGAALPQPLGVPPSLTIGAWADYVAETFIARHAGTQVRSQAMPSR